MKAIILAGGLGTRLRPLTYNRPKPMVSVANKPFVIHQIELLKKYGITEIVLNLHYLSETMELMLGDGKEFGVKLYYSIEDTPLGTAGAVKNAQEYFDGETMIVFNGDVLTDINISEIIDYHRSVNACATLTLTEVADPSPYGLVVLEDGFTKGKVNKFIEKPKWTKFMSNYINAGIYVLEPKIFDNVPFGKNFSFERQLFPGLLESGENMHGFLSDSYWIDIGSPQKYMQVHKDILNEDVSVIIDGEKRSGNAWVQSNANISSAAKIHGPVIIGKKTVIAPNSKINQFSVVGAGVRVNDGAVIDSTIIHRNSIIGRDVKLKDCIIGENCIIEDFVEIGSGVIMADYSIVKKGSKLI